MTCNPDAYSTGAPPFTFLRRISYEGADVNEASANLLEAAVGLRGAITGFERPDHAPTGGLVRVTGSPTGPDLQARPGDDESLEAHRLRASAEILIEIADRLLDAPALDMSPADSARVGAATRLTERALQIVISSFSCSDDRSGPTSRSIQLDRKT
jgi:hypothetical protein